MWLPVQYVLRSGKCEKCKMTKEEVRRAHKHPQKNGKTEGVDVCKEMVKSGD